jgi:hypothetical protein
MRKFLEIAFAALLIVSGFVVMSGAPPAIVQRLNEDLVRVISDPVTKARIAQMGFDPLPGPPQRWSISSNRTPRDIVRSRG